MNTLEQAARQALDALNKAFEMRVTNHPKWEGLARTTITALSQALEQTKRKEGCAECGKLTSDGWALYCVKCSEPMRGWVGLTDEELVAAYMSVGDKEWAIAGMEDATKHAKAIEAKLRELNT
jgi:hypothetical protein